MVSMAMVASRDNHPVLVVITGVQGTGKSTLAARVATALGAQVTMLAAEALSEGSSVVVEGVFAAHFRHSLQADAQALGARCVVVECVCSDVALHQQRVEARHASGSSAISWQRVLDDQQTYEGVPTPDYIADAVAPVEQHVHAIATLAGSAP